MKRFLALVAASFVAMSAHAQTPKPPGTTPPAKPGAAPATTPPAKPTPPPTAAPTPLPDGVLNNDQAMEKLYSEAASAFNQTRYDVALQQIGAIHKLTNNKDFEQVMFLEGACLFNLEKYPEAIEILKKFITTFKDSEHFAEASLALGRAYMKDPAKAESEGIPTLKKLVMNKDVIAKTPELRTEIGLEIADYYKKHNSLDEALKILQSITTDGPTTQNAIRAILMKAEIFLSKTETENAQAALEELRKGTAADESVVQINEISRKIALDMMEAKNWREALVTLQNVRRKSEIMRIQNNRLARIQEWKKDADANKPVFFLGRKLGKDEVDAMLTANQKILEELEKAKDYDASVYYLLGQCFYELQRNYESFVAFQKVYNDFKTYPDRDLALFGMIVNTAALKQPSKSVKFCERYIADYPDGGRITQVTDMYGTLIYQSGDIDGAIKAFRRARDAKGADKERLSFMLGNILFEAQRFEDARLELQALLKEFKGSAFRDDSEYRIALTYFFENKSKEAVKAFDTYISNNPKGQYIVDAKYRKAFITYQSANTNQGGNIQTAIDILEQLVKDAPADVSIGQVWVLLGDIYNSKQESDKAKDAYRNGFKSAHSEDVLMYSLDNLTTLLTGDNQWPEVREVWSTVYSTHKDGPLALKCIYWIAKATQREARSLEQEHKYAAAEQKLNDARNLVAEALRPQLTDPKNEQVEVLIQQLISQMAPKRRPIKSKKAAEGKPAAGEAKTADAKPAADKPADAVPAKTAEGAPADKDKPAAEAGAAPAVAAEEEPPPPMTFEQAEEMMKKLLTPEGDQNLTNGTAAARLLYARAQLARMYFPKDLSKFESLISIIPDAAKSEELSPLLLSTLAEMLLKKGDTEKAAEYFGRLRDVFPKSEFADRAPVGLGDIEYGKGNYDEALKLYEEAISKSEGSSAMLDATIGKGKCFLKLKRLDQAEKVFKQIVQVKDWKSEWAQGFYWLGQIAEAGKKWNEAIDSYLRVIYGYQRDKNWLAKCYIQAAKCFLQPDFKQPTTDKNGKPIPGEAPDPRKEAKRLLEEMMRKNGIPELPEYKEAQDLLAKNSN